MSPRLSFLLLWDPVMNLPERSRTSGPMFIEIPGEWHGQRMSGGWDLVGAYTCQTNSLALHERIGYLLFGYFRCAIFPR